MLQRPKLVRYTAAAALVTTTLLISGAGQSVRARSMSPRVTSTCAQLGSYQIGPQITPLRAAHGRPPAATGQASPRWPATTLQGTLTLSAYTACGHATAGSFAVRRVPLGPLPQPQHTGTGAAMPCQSPCAIAPYGIVAVSGSFTQDAAHPADPAYVSVSAIMTVTQAGPALMRPCAQNAACPTRAVITSTVTATSITGYLQFFASGIQASPTDGPPAGQRLALSFLPPPLAFAGADPSALVLHAWRGNLAPPPSTATAP